MFPFMQQQLQQYVLLHLLFVLPLFLTLVQCQVAASKCVPAGLCFPQTPDINPRIVTEGGSGNVTKCRAGYELCYPKEGSFQCGTRYVPGVSNANGATTLGAQPWQVYLVNQTGKYMGSGVLLTDRIILTAAHKVYLNIKTPNLVKIYLGVHNPTGIKQPPAALRTAAAIVVHKDFLKKAVDDKDLDYKDNIALILMDRPYSMRYRIDVGLGCLPNKDESFSNKECIVGGWGETQFQMKDEGQVHKQVTMKIVSMDTCKASMEKPTVLGPAGTAKYLDTVNELCAGGEFNKDACTQDGGAPLMCFDDAAKRYIIAGLVNWGKGCGREGVYGVYVNVAKYTDWINDNIAALE